MSGDFSGSDSEPERDEILELTDDRSTSSAQRNRGSDLAEAKEWAPESHADLAQYEYVASRRGTMDSDPSEFPNPGHTLRDLTGPSESDRCKKIKGEAELFLEFINHKKMIPVFVEKNIGRTMQMASGLQHASA